MAKSLESNGGIATATATASKGTGNPYQPGDIFQVKVGLCWWKGNAPLVKPADIESAYSKAKAEPGKYRCVREADLPVEAGDIVQTVRDFGSFGESLRVYEAADLTYATNLLREKPGRYRLLRVVPLS
jgi:hypothetical protein